MNIRLIKEGQSKVCKHYKDKMPQEKTIDSGAYPNLIQMLRDCDANENTTGISVIDKHKGYEVMFNVVEGWSMNEKDKGRQCVYDGDNQMEGCPTLTESIKSEIDTLAALIP